MPVDGRATIDDLAAAQLGDANAVVALTAADAAEAAARVAADAALAAAATVRVANTQTVDYTLVLADAGKAVEINSATAKNVTVPPNASVAFPVGTIIEVPQVGAGSATLVAGVGVTITGDTVTPGQGGSLLLRKTGTNAWWSAIGAVRSGTYVQYIALAGDPDLLITGAITRDANDAATSAPVTWPDGTPGVYTATTVSAAFPGAVDAYTVTYGSPATRTYTQPAVTRNANGAVTTRPAITVA